MLSRESPCSQKQKPCVGQAGLCDLQKRFGPSVASSSETTAEVFKDPADCHPSSFMGHRVYPVARHLSFQPNPPAGGPIVEALEHSRRGGTTSPLDSTSKEMEVMGCRFYHAALIAFSRCQGYMAYMTQYQQNSGKTWRTWSMTPSLIVERQDVSYLMAWMQASGSCVLPGT